MDLWRFADGRELQEIISNFENPGMSEDQIKAALACLVEGGLLTRSIPPEIPSPKNTVTGKMVSVVIVAYNGKDWLLGCLPSILAQTYSPIEIIIVDNASSDPLDKWIKEKFPQAKVLTLAKPHTIPAANNCGVTSAAGDYFLLLNQDTRLEPNAVAEMVAVIESDLSCVAVAPKLRIYWAPAFLNGIGNRVLVNSWGTDNAIGHLDLGQFDHWDEIPSACTAAALFSRWGWEEVGAMDEGFPMYYDDPEWSYRAQLAGYLVLAAPKSVVYHAFGGRVPESEIEPLTPAKLHNVVYGRYRFTIKLLEQMRGKLLRNYWVEDWARFCQAISKRNWPVAKAYLSAWFKVLKDLPAIRREHRLWEPHRVISDEDLFALQKGYPDLATWNNLPELTWERIINQYYPLIFNGKTRRLPEFTMGSQTGHITKRQTFLIVSQDVVDEKMGGPGARYLEIAKALCQDLDVTLAVPANTSLKIPGIRLVEYAEDRPASLETLVENHDIALISGYMPYKFRFLLNTTTRLVVDLYDPFFLENIYYYLDQPFGQQMEMNNSAIYTANQLMRIGDFFICGTERQRDFWLGMLASNYRINPHTFTDDTRLRRLIDVVGVGFPNREPLRSQVVRGVKVPQDAKIIVWGGGIWNWLDPLTLVRAWPEVLERHQDACLVFLGTRYPNPVVPAHKMASETIKLASRIGEKDRSIFFIEWLPYQDHQALLCESDIGVTFQPDHIEAHFSIRTRVIDYFWAQLPVVVSEGDITAEWVRQYQVGKVVPTSDPEAIAQTLNEMLDVPKAAYTKAFQVLRDDFVWDKVVQPLRNYCLYGERAPDRQRKRYLFPGENPQGAILMRPRNPITHATSILQEEGLFALMRRSVRHLVWFITRA